jgi:hypothetical protein
MGPVRDTTANRKIYSIPLSREREISMKTKQILILFVMACLLLVAAGCTGTPAAAPASTGAAAPSFSGTWKTTWLAGEQDIPMTLTQTGSAVAGTYEYSDGTITGTVEGSTLTGTWTENKGDSKGPVVFVIAADGKTFSGWWAHDYEDFDLIRKESPTWTGKRA